MLKIFYSMSGEGRGHAVRVMTVTEALRQKNYQIHLFAPAQAYEFLAPIYQGTAVKITRIPELVFKYNAQGKVAYGITFFHMLHYVVTRRWRFRHVAQLFRQEKPDLVLVDFEPGLPRLARQFGVPWVSLDHQHFLRTYDLSSLPKRLRWHLWYMSFIVSLYGSRPCHRIVSSFYFPPLRTGLQNITQIGTLFRSVVRNAQTSDAGHVTVYLRRGIVPNVRDALLKCGRKVEIFTSNPETSQDNLEYFPITPDRFIDSLRQCAMLLTTAGNQLLGEALFMGKPVLVMPEPNNIEQEINGHFLTQDGGGLSVPMEQLSSQVLMDFLAKREHYLLDETQRKRLDGLETTLDVLDEVMKSL